MPLLVLMNMIYLPLKVKVYIQTIEGVVGLLSYIHDVLVCQVY